MSEEWDRLAQALFDRRTALGISRQRVADLAGVSLGAVKNLEKKGNSYRRMPSSLAPVVEVLGWTRDSPRKVLAGGEPALEESHASPAEEDDAPLEDRYQRRDPVTDAGRLVDVVDDMVYRVFMFGRPDAPFEQYDRTRRRVFEVLREAGIDIAERNDGASSGVEPEA